ncbi:HEAT repeat domain-containing protein [Algoriphagus sp. D3-2-R+10]|uniref:HEAT repeat domain-containing protein n=1 Tax=Algoriphagus aurantiacus TaxID=3103948 RepID=UPI002B39D345|nr:HEAT repeat domain-containing protein [Algoriphagus sp. D3-2-R+10]MEB2775262.1 HEAT repeat domain-containing protein [Algoriphagus sp. D3-2-R+10]
MKAKNAFALVFLLFLVIKIGEVFGQEELVLTDSSSFVDFLISEGEIPGLHFRLVDSSHEIILDSVLNSNSSSGMISDFNTILALKDKLLMSDSLVPQVQYLIYEEPNTFAATQEYVSNLLRNGDLVAKTADTSNGKDLISLASRERYSPFLKGTYAYFGDFKIFAVSIIISVFFISAFTMILFMMIFKARRNRKEVLQGVYDEQVVGPLSEILFEKTLEELELLSDEELYENFPAKLLKKPLYVQVLVERILALNKTMKGDFKLKLKALYRRLELDKRSIKKLHSSKWDKVVIGLVEVNEMDLTEAMKDVRKLVNSPNFYIRSQAVATLLNLSDSVDLSFLRDQTFPLSTWQQMNYLRIIKFLNSSRDLNINSLFCSNNQSIRLFGYKLVRILGLVDLLAELEEKFESVSDEEKIEIIKTFEYLGIPTQTELINGSLKSENKELVSAAAKAAGSIGDDTTARIICKILEESPDFRQKMNLLKSLQNLNKELYRQFIFENSTSDLRRIDKHLLDPLLQDV